MMITALGCTKRVEVVLAAAMLCTAVCIAQTDASSAPGPSANAISPDAANLRTPAMLAALAGSHPTPA